MEWSDESLCVSPVHACVWVSFLPSYTGGFVVDRAVYVSHGLQDVEGDEADLVKPIATLPPALGWLDHLSDREGFCQWEGCKVYQQLQIAFVKQRIKGLLWWFLKCAIKWLASLCAFTNSLILLPPVSPPAALKAHCCSWQWSHNCSSRVCQVGVNFWPNETKFVFIWSRLKKQTTKTAVHWFMSCRWLTCHRLVAEVVVAVVGAKQKKNRQVKTTQVSTKCIKYVEKYNVSVYLGKADCIKVWETKVLLKKTKN